MSVGVKICGLTTVADIEYAVSHGADAIGIVLVPSPREVDRELARDLLLAAGPNVIKVAVFRTVSTVDVSGLADLGFDAVQGQGAGAGAPDIPGGLGFLPVITDGADLLARANSALGTLRGLGNPTLLLDGPGGGGRGERVVTARARRLARSYPIVLAGGLTPDNVAWAVNVISPVAVDVSSGVESRPGRKDHGKVQAFIEAARAAAPRTEPIS